MNSNPTGLIGITKTGMQSAGTATEAALRSRKLLLAATAITVALWFLPSPYNDILYPLRLFVTFIHESGHALTAILTGGSVESLTVFRNGEGVTMTRTPYWAGWLVLSGGYLGTTVFGALLLQAGRLSRWQNAGRNILYACAISLLVITLVWGHFNPFTLIAGIVLAALLGGLARLSTPRVAEFVASFLAVQCCLNALGDLRILLYLTTNAPGADNDAVFMQRQYMLPAVFWAALWAVSAIVILALALRSYWRATEAHTGRIVA
jgi:hypothetical protein